MLTSRTTTTTTTVRTFCRVCIAGCGVVASVVGDQITEIRGDPGHPLSDGYTCAKGRALAAAHHAPNRLREMQVRRAGELVPVGVDEGLDDLAAALNRVIEEHGPGSVGVFKGTGGFLDPAGNWAMSRLARRLGTRQLYSTASVDGIAKAYVTALMSGTSALIPHPDPACRLLLIVGSNPVVSHGQYTGFANPIERFRAFQENGEIVVVDPRRTESARLADHHLHSRSGTDHVLLGHLVRRRLESGVSPTVAGRLHGLDDLAAAVDGFDLDTASAVTGLPPWQIAHLDALIERFGRLAVVTGTGTTMSPPANLVEWFAWSLMLLTDSFDRPGGMWFNPGFMARVDQRDRLPAVTLDQPGSLSRPDIPHLQNEYPSALLPAEIEAGRLKALVVLGANLPTALPDDERVMAALAQLAVLAVFDIVPTETTAAATHVIATTDQLERPDLPSLDLFRGHLGTQYTPAVVPAPPEHPEMWRSIVGLAARLGHDLLDGEPIEATGTDDILRRLARGADFDALVAAGGPVMEAETRHGWVHERLPTGRWDIAPAPLVAQLRTLPKPAPLVLTPRRQPRRQNSQVYRPGDLLRAEIHPDDAAPLNIVDGAQVLIRSAYGELEVQASVTDSMARGSVSIPHGWREANPNRVLSADDLDPGTGMPRLSGTPVTISPVPATRS